MPSLSFKIAFPIIITGFFVIVSFVALNYENLNTGFYIIFSFLILYVFFFGFAIGQNFTAPVRRLLKKADDLSKGDLKSRVYIESKDEIGQLSNVFNKIADRLEESNDENEKTKKSVGIKVEAETRSLKEVINALEQKVQNRTLEIQKMMGDLDKFKEYAKAKEAESEELKNQMLELRGRLEKHGVKKGRSLSAEMIEKKEKQTSSTTDSRTQALKETISDLEQKVQSRTVEFEKVAGDLEKFQKYSKLQEAEILKLENQINKLIKKSGTQKTKKLSSLET